MTRALNATPEEQERLRRAAESLTAPSPAAAGLPDEDVERVELVARCENYREPDGGVCPGLLVYRWGQIEAVCDTCGGRCGIAVAAWLEVRAALAPVSHDADGGERR